MCLMSAIRPVDSMELCIYLLVALWQVFHAMLSPQRISRLCFCFGGPLGSITFLLVMIKEAIKVSVSEI